MTSAAGPKPPRTIQCSHGRDRVDERIYSLTLAATVKTANRWMV